MNASAARFRASDAEWVREHYPVPADADAAIAALVASGEIEIVDQEGVCNGNSNRKN